ncbi:MAG: DNA polymerase III subunit gamma/tau [Elusimicrobia bacterium]|jgi:DNA polymerase-3 subunit gamma/tau|nr:DNA polymerase III subunit gamma/tau [Elusimicrobiota bacterium]MBK7544705.1 DNA polymerase III subunit gamma/tau [Elusimicrobiota bacterium]MBK7688823.1 DNA polymerase III subunit gamma/tau [Elusimicrobiota bacterium]MBK8126367.1 DNA polymerase III subunit gamma/tau [Elusimicrobiota bacterium]MBK8422328.1 DNA polymerase III subunit gamma/tau [Elusimicrobiota bacterium]
MGYLVLARKYRPQTFDDLVGQEHIAKTLTNALEAKRLAHAYVFSGPRGCGKTTTARILAKALNCVKGPTASPCGECPQCRDIAAGSSTDDVLEIDGASNRGIDQIRELRDTVKYAPARSRYRVIIIDEAHQISKDGFNALLKTLEEPPPHVVFMMATTEAQKIPETILSRCQRFQVRAIAPADIVGRLKHILTKENIALSDETLHEVARAGRGSLRDALSLLDQVLAFAPGGATAADVRGLLGLLPKEFVRGFAATLRKGSPPEILQSVQKALEDGFDLSQLAEDLLERHHRLLLWQAGVRDPHAPDAAELDAETSNVSLEGLERSVAVLARAVADLRRSESPRVTFELACLELAQDPVPVRELLERLESLEKSLAGGSPLPARTAPVAPPRVAPPPASATPAAVAPVLATPAPRAETDGNADLTSAWSRLTAEMGRTKPSLEALLAAARPEWVAPGVLRVLCDNDFQKGQLAGHERLWSEALHKQIGPFAIQWAVAPAVRPAARPAPPAPTPEPAEEAEVVDDAAPETETEGPVVEGADEDARAQAAQDPGVRKVLEKFPGKVRRVER